MRAEQRARPQDERQVLRLLLREAAVNPAFGGDPAVDARRRLDAIVEHDREIAPDVVARDLAEALPGLGLQGEADGRLVVLVDGRPGAAQVGPAHDRRLPHQVIRRAASSPVPLTTSIPARHRRPRARAPPSWTHVRSTSFSSRRPVV